MNRQTRPVLLTATTVLGTLAISTLTACSASTNGRLTGSSGPTGPSVAVSSAANPASASAGATSGTDTADGSAVGASDVSGSTASTGNTHSGSGNSPAGGTNHAGPAHANSVPAPSFAYTTITCEVTDHEDITGLGSVPLYSPVLTWKVQHATGMALSVDNPGLVGAYGTYGPSGSLTLGGGCYQGESALVEFYTVGGHGPAAHRTYHRTGTMTRPTAPPFANGSGTASASATPSPSPSS